MDKLACLSFLLFVVGTSCVKFNKCPPRKVVGNICVNLCNPADNHGCDVGKICCRNACGGTQCVCPVGKPEVQCYMRPCRNSACLNIPYATCHDDNCGGCFARWFANGREVTQYCINYQTGPLSASGPGGTIGDSFGFDSRGTSGRSTGPAGRSIGPFTGPGGRPHGSFTGPGGRPDGPFTGPGGRPDGSFTGPGGRPDGPFTGPGGRPDGSFTGPGGNPYSYSSGFGNGISGAAGSSGFSGIGRGKKGYY